VFKLELGRTAEFLLTYPATWFGLPGSAWGLAPLAITFCSELRHLPSNTASYSTLTPYGLGSHEAFTFVALGLIPAALWAAVHARYLNKGEFVECYLMTKYLMFPATQLPIWLAHYVGASFHTGAWYVIAWIAAETIGFLLKLTSARLRPRVSPELALHLGKVRRAYPEVQTMLMKGESAVESFPSGDTIGAAVFSAVLWQVGAPAWTHGFGVLPSVLPCSPFTRRDRGLGHWLRHGFVKQASGGCEFVKRVPRSSGDCVVYFVPRALEQVQARVAPGISRGGKKGVLKTSIIAFQTPRHDQAPTIASFLVCQCSCNPE
jgi:hypothetical protein